MRSVCLSMSVLLGLWSLSNLYPSPTFAQHLRIYACVIANDSAGAFMGASSNGSGLYQSDDTGKTWKHLGWNNIKCYSMDMVQSSNGRIIYMATGLGVLRSSDYGEHWKQLTDWRISEVMDIDIFQEEPEFIWLATARGPWFTEDTGRSWKQQLEGLKEPFVLRITQDGPPKHHDVSLWNGTSAHSYILNTDEWTENDYPSLKDLFEDRDVSRLLHIPFSPKIEKLLLLPHLQVWTLKSFLVTP